MTYLFGPAGSRALEKLKRTSALLVFDYDGTLAPIVEERDKADIPLETRALFRKLCRKQKVAVISGRGLKDVARRVRPGPRFIVGNHGLEGPATNERVLRKAKQVVQAWVRELKKASLDIEDKVFSLSIHYRSHASDREHVRRLCEKLVPAPRIIPGKKVFNLLPPEGPDKGVALRALLRKTRATASLYIGDDWTDESAFVAASVTTVTVRVGRKRDSYARYFVRGHRDVDRLLKLLI